jgi:hypothetical protein
MSRDREISRSRIQNRPHTSFINANLLTTVKRSLILKVKNLREYHGHAHLTPDDDLD